jgi:hypothetical protein
MPRFVMRLLSFVIVATFFVLVATGPASAALTVSLKATPSVYQGSCPATMVFSGMISGTPDTTFRYSFKRNINDKQQILVMGSATIPSSGSLAIKDSFDVISTSSGSNFDQVWVHHIEHKKGSVYSPRVHFSVTCVAAPTPTPLPTPAQTTVPSSGVVSGHPLSHGASTSGHSGALLYGVPPPFNLMSTTDPKVCGKHGGLAGLFCIQAVPDKYLILVWNWTPNERWPSIDGYHVYDVTGGGKIHVQDQTNPQATVEFFKPGTYESKCYAVSAYKGTAESPTSESFCASSAHVGLQTITLSNPTVGTRGKIYDLAENGDSNYSYHEPPIDIGFSYRKTIDLGRVEYHRNEFYRAYFVFPKPANALYGLNVAKATLLVTRDGPDQGTLNSLHCLGAIGAAMTNWVDSDNFTEGDFSYDVPWSQTEETETFDVTRIVRDWASRARLSYGFVIKGTSEDLGSDAQSEQCLLRLLPNATLTVEYYR